MLNYQRCPVCGEPVSPTWKGDGNRLICPFCNTICSQQTDEDTITEHELKAIYSLLDQLEFEEAAKRLGSLKEHYPNNSRLYFLTCLAENHVCYTQDAVDNKKYIPTLNDLPEGNIHEHPFAKKAISLAESEEVRQSYQNCFDYLEQKRLEIAQQRKELHYDIFISVKVSEVDEEGRIVYDAHNKQVRTKDYDLAYQTYLFLREQFPDLKVFFSESTDAKELMAGNRYENVIYAALHSAKAFILVADSRANIEWRWVRNEWKRYLLASEKDPIGHHLVLLTTDLKPNDLPPELKGREFIDASSIFRANEVLKAFITKNCYGAARIKAKTFEATKIGPKTIRGPEMSVASKNLKHYKDTGSASLDATLDRLSVDLDPTNPVVREEAFEELETIAKEHPDLFRAQALLLLKGTNIPSFDALASDLKLLLDNLELFKSYLGLVDDKAGRATLEHLLNCLGSAKTMTEYSGEKINKALHECILPYLEFIEAASIERFLANAESHFDLIARDSKGVELLRTLIDLHRFLDKDDPILYQKRREDYASRIAKIRKPKEEVLRFASALVRESFDVDPTNANSALLALEMLNNAPTKTYEEAVANFSYITGLCAHCVGDTDRLDFIRVLLQNGPENGRKTFLAAFLLAIIKDEKTYEDFGKEEGDDAELSGYALFMRYIGYPLPAEWPTAFQRRSINAQTTLNPDPSVFAYAKKPTPLGILLARFGVQCHLKGQYGRAKELYGYYLGEQEDLLGEDCLLIRFYSALAMSRAASIKDLQQSNELLDYKQLGIDMVTASKENPNIQGLYAAINDAYSKQKETVRLYDLCAQELDELRFYLNADTTNRAKQHYLAIKQTLSTFKAPSLSQEAEKMNLRIKELEEFVKRLEREMRKGAYTENLAMLNERLKRLTKLRADLERIPYQSEKKKASICETLDKDIASAQETIASLEKRNQRYESYVGISKVLGFFAVSYIGLASFILLLTPCIGLFPWQIHIVAGGLSMALPLLSLLCIGMRRARFIFWRRGVIIPDLHALVLLYAALVLFIYDVNTGYFGSMQGPLAVMGCFLTVAILALGHIISEFNPGKRRYIGAFSGYISYIAFSVALSLPIIWLMANSSTDAMINLRVKGFFDDFVNIPLGFWCILGFAFLCFVALSVICVVAKKKKKSLLFSILTGAIATLLSHIYLFYIFFFIAVISGQLYTGPSASIKYGSDIAWAVLGLFASLVPTAIVFLMWLVFAIRKRKKKK